MDELEALLRQFQPRRPKPLPERARPRRPRSSLWILVPGLAAVVIIVVNVKWHARVPAVEGPRVVITLGALNAHGLTSAETLDNVLTRTSRAILPNVEQPGGVLHALSKE